VRCKNKTEEDLEEKTSKLQEKIQVLLTEEEAMQHSMEMLQKKLKMSEAHLLQSSSQMWQNLAQMHMLKEGKECSAQEVLQLKTTLEELRSQLEETLPPQPPPGPTEAEQCLQEQAHQ
jgi:chromosome segregation ATPase